LGRQECRPYGRGSSGGFPDSYQTVTDGGAPSGAKISEKSSSFRRIYDMPENAYTGFEIRQTLMETNNDKFAATLNKYLKVEDGPAFGGGSLSADDDKLYSGLAHPFSLIVWLWKRKASPAVDAHGKEALNAAITLMIFWWLPVTLVFTVLGGLLFKVAILRWVIWLAMTLVNLAVLAVFIYGLLKAREGKLLRYPFNLRLIK
jgi:uncharacterized Tic20 family protein